MSDASHDSTDGGEDEARAIESAEGVATAVGARAASDKSLVTTPLAGLMFALLAGLAVWGALEVIPPVFQLPQELQDLGGNAPADEQKLLSDTLKLTKDRNAIFSLVVLASTLALVLSGTELRLRRTGFRIVWGGLLAGVIAGVIALGAGAVAVGVHDSLKLPSHGLGKAILVQGSMLGLTGLGIGLAIGTPIFRSRLLVTCLIGCLLGGMLTALVFPIAASICLPDLNTDHLVPASGLGRLLWVVLATGLIGVTATGLGKEKKKAP